MGLEYNLSEIDKLKQQEELRLELAPRNQCRDYVLANGSTAHLIEKKEFDSLLRKKQFIDGPFKDSFGDGYGEPYNPNRQAYGKLEDKTVVYCELSSDHQEKAKKLLKTKDN